MRKSQAQLKAEAFQRLAVQYGLRVNVSVEQIPAQMYDHDPSRVMLPARTIAHVHFYDDPFGDFGSAGWVTWEADEYSRAGTRYIGNAAHVYRHGRRNLKLRTPRKLYAWLSSYSYRLPADEATRITEEFADTSKDFVE